MEDHVLGPPSHHFDIIRKERRQCLEVIHENEKQELCIGVAPECSPERYASMHDDITKTEGLHFRQKKSVVDGVKGLGQIKVYNINCMTLVHHARHRYLENQQIGGTGPTE